MIIKMNGLDTVSSYRLFKLPGSLSNLDFSELQDIKETTMSPNQANTSVTSNTQDAGKQLLDACKIGDINEVRQLVDNGAPLSADWLGTSPLHLASQYGHTETVDILLKAGASRDTRTKVDRTPLHCASLEGHLSIVNLLLNNGAEIDARDLLKMTPLHWAVERGHYDVVEYLLANGSDVTLLSKFDKTPIDIAYDNGRTDMIPLLEKHVNSNRSKSNNQVLAIQSIKTRPTILPNKSNRNQKLVKTPNSTSNNNLNDSSISSTNNNNKSIAIESIKKIMNNSAIVKKEANTSPNKITTRSSSVHNNTTQMNMSDAKEALQWLEKNGLATASSTTTNGKDDDRQTTGSTNKTPSKNNIITIAVNNSNFNQLIKNSQTSPFVIINSNDLDDKNKKVIKLDKVCSANKSNNNNTIYSTVENSDLDDFDMPQNDRLKQELQSVKNENKLLKEGMKNLKVEIAALKKDLERKDKIIDDYKKKFN